LPAEKLDLEVLAMTYLKRIIYNCKQATFLIEKKSITRLSFREMIELRIHLYGCLFCRIYDTQSQRINEMVQELFRSSMQAGFKLDDDFKKELQGRIEEELNKN
jgi:hypothetical protein